MGRIFKRWFRRFWDMDTPVKNEFFGHWSQIPYGFWKWKNFTPKEIACKGNGSIMVDFDAMTRFKSFARLSKYRLHPIPPIGLLAITSA